MKRIINHLRKYKFKAKRLLVVAFLSTIEIILLLWGNGWAYTPAIWAVFIQFYFIWEKKQEELEEEDIKLFIRGIMAELRDGKSAKEILEKIKKED